MNADSVVGIPRGDGDTQILPYAKNLLELFALQGCKHARCEHSCPSPLVKLSLFFTGRNEVVAKVMFLHVSVILYTGGVSGEPPQDQADTPPGRENPPRPGRTPPGRETPPAGRTPLAGRTLPPPLPAGRTPPGPGRSPPGEDDCSIRSMSGRYASYWDAFLFYLIFNFILM